MKQKILELLKKRREINLTEFHNLIPESNGKYAMFMPTKPGFNPNILWMAEVTSDFIKAFNELLINEKLIEFKPAHIMCYFFDGSPIYADMKLFEDKHMKKQTECWMPIVVTLKHPEEYKSLLEMENS